MNVFIYFIVIHNIEWNEEGDERRICRGRRASETYCNIYSHGCNPYREYFDGDKGGGTREAA
jgi:hypothetical protein